MRYQLRYVRDSTDFTRSSGADATGGSGIGGCGRLGKRRAAVTWIAAPVNAPRGEHHPHDERWPSPAAFGIPPAARRGVRDPVAVRAGRRALSGGYGVTRPGFLPCCGGAGRVASG